MAELIIEREKLKKNIEIIRSKTNSRIIAVVKGNGYGLGLMDMARFYLEEEIDMLAVSDRDEALSLCRLDPPPRILYMAPPRDMEEARTLVKNNIICTVSSISSARLLNDAAGELNTPVRVHIKIDTGFGRFGFTNGDLIPLKDYNHLKYEGCYSHFSSSFSPSPKHTMVQFRNLLDAKQSLEKMGITPQMVHICNSAAFFKYPEMHLDAVRIGSAFLGRIPIKNTFGLLKVGYLMTSVSEVKSLSAGHTVGYANTYKTKKPIQSAVIDAGYAHGLNMEKGPDTFRLSDTLRWGYRGVKLFGARLHVTINDRPVPILGRIGMYHTVVDITSLKVNPGDPVRIEVNPLFVPSGVKRIYL